ncbi:MAG TPA: SIMPL domain-containing protein [Chloroflexota bacterium]|nr:SIMPL domain-containing protein [Chloroflexota bacterium]
MNEVSRVAKIGLGSTLIVGIIVAMTACSGATTVTNPAAESTATTAAKTTAPTPATGSQVVAPAPARGAPVVAPAPAQGYPNTAPAPAPGAPAQGAPGIAPGPPPGPVGNGSSSAVVGAPAVSGLGRAQPAAAPMSSVASFPQPIAPAPAADAVHGIVVSGSGRVNLRPDQATVTAGVQTQGRTAQEAQTENNQSMNAVVAAIKGLGIPDKDIQTVGVSLYPMFNQGQTVSGYTASNNVSVLVENVDQAGPVLDAVVKAGANESSNVQFGLKDETAARNQALALAATDARSKADALAGALGLKITGVQSVSESSGSNPIVVSPMAMTSAPSAPTIPIQPGELGVTAQVTIVFAI